MSEGNCSDGMNMRGVGGWIQVETLIGESLLLKLGFLALSHHSCQTSAASTISYSTYITWGCWYKVHNIRVWCTFYQHYEVVSGLYLTSLLARLHQLQQPCITCTLYQSVDMTQCRDEFRSLSGSVTEILTACRMHKILFAWCQIEAEIRGFPTMYINGGG